MTQTKLLTGIQFRAVVAIVATASLTFGTIVSADESEDGAFSMHIEDAHAIVGGGTVITGRIESGSISTGETVCVPLYSGPTVARKVGGIEEWSKKLDSAKKGMAVGLLVQDVDDADVNRGSKLNTECGSAPEEE